MIYLYSHFPLVASAVHITIHDIIKAPCLINPDDLDIMFAIIFAAVNSFISAETEYFCKRIFCLVIAPQLPLLYKGYCSPSLICLILHISRTYSKFNIIIKKVDIFPTEDLIHTAFKIKQIHTAARITHTIIFFYIIIFQFPIISGCRHNIIQ